MRRYIKTLFGWMDIQFECEKHQFLKSDLKYKSVDECRCKKCRKSLSDIMVNDFEFELS